MKALIILFLAFLLFSQFSSTVADTPEDTRQLNGHGGPVNCVSISPDGKQVISGSLDYTVMLWDIDKPRPKNTKRFQEHRGAVSEVRFLPSGAEAVSSGDDGTVYLWDVKKHKLLHRFVGHQAKVVSVDVTPDGKMLASASWDGSVRLWDLSSREALHEIKVHEQTVHSVLLSADGKTAYSGGYDGRIRSWDTRTGNLIKVIHEHGWPINVMRWFSNQILFGTSNGDVQLLDVASASISKILIPHQKPVLGLAVSNKHGLIASGGIDGVIRVWDTQDWSVTGETEGIPGPVWALAFTADGKGIYFGSLDDDVKYWKISTSDDTNWSKGHKQRRFQVKAGLPLGELQFARKCSVCHSLDPDVTNRAGPSLYKIMGRKAGSLPEYPYSKGLIQSDVVWNEKTIDELFVKGPSHVVPGSKMPLQKIPDAEKRTALINFLKKQ
ncbi:MAG: cytochrome C [Candidatus Thiodiazotropha sp. (ex Semelilucina semeliformis)]|nr:cytochrome C [Candidatus Thiodiazotropha sp. (ex Semelilucina semeliformis)]